ncbi:uncharacterized protein LOC109860213 [Pseudomyrmex gracilis]|uniref:uncharacterized protein LOC109860213 n=1 Tax=Pseudomyrmex gracilis TaxID=219809 RepID=UPI000995B181|nr:uncharacterized protein LOC109860213 [Pseudomyrmex gracilis]
MVQSFAELDGAVAVAAEPYNVPDHPLWSGSADGSVAVYWGELVVVGRYFSPTRPFQEFREYLDELNLVVKRHLACPVLILGDFNSKSVTWGSPRTDQREMALEDMLAACGLSVVNEGLQHTCVRQSGGSIVDVTFASPLVAARSVSEWRVRDDMEILSDHKYITMRVDVLLARQRGRRWAK